MAGRSTSVGVTLGSASFALAAALLTSNPFVGFATYAFLSQAANAIYYNYFADASSPITNSSYTNGHLTRWQRLDYMKTKFADAGDRTPYDLNKMRYYGEYSAHMYGYFVFGRGPLSGSLDEADVNLYSLDGRFFGLIDFAESIRNLV